MFETRGDLWEIGKTGDAIVITTNGTQRSNGENVMGGGCALEAALKFPWLPAELGRRIQKKGNHVHVFHYDSTMALVTFPTKENVARRSILPLIIRSTQELIEYADDYSWKKVVLPRPGCGLGGLSWEEVGPILSEMLDDRFTVVTFA